MRESSEKRRQNERKIKLPRKETKRVAGTITSSTTVFKHLFLFIAKGVNANSDTKEKIKKQGADPAYHRHLCFLLPMSSLVRSVVCVCECLFSIPRSFSSVVTSCLLTEWWVPSFLSLHLFVRGLAPLVF